MAVRFRRAHRNGSDRTRRRDLERSVGSGSIVGPGWWVLILVEAALEVVVKFRASLLYFHGDGVPTLCVVPVDGAS
jgi:hypothetical protein